MKFNFLPVILCLALTGCLLPEAPTSRDFTTVDSSNPEYTVRTLARNPDPTTPDYARPYVHREAFAPTTQGMRSRAKNLLFITADDLLEQQFSPMIAKAYGTQTPPSLNELSWWQLVPYFRDLYNQVIYLPLEQTHYTAISVALRDLESRGLPYDVIILSHGYPNYLTDGRNGYFISFREIDELKGQLPHLNLVFTQGCYSESLAPDWLGTGAKIVISFQGLNRNFFFIGVFLDRYRYEEAKSAFVDTNVRMYRVLSSSLLYSRLINEGLGMSVPEYLTRVDEPRVDF